METMHLIMYVHMHVYECACVCMCICEIFSFCVYNHSCSIFYDKCSIKKHTLIFLVPYKFLWSPSKSTNFICTEFIPRGRVLLMPTQSICCDPLDESYMVVVFS
jgi:hypothetical protein